MHPDEDLTADYSEGEPVGLLGKNILVGIRVPYAGHDGRGRERWRLVAVDVYEIRNRKDPTVHKIVKRVSIDHKTVRSMYSRDNIPYAPDQSRGIRKIVPLPEAVREELAQIDSILHPIHRETNNPQCIIHNHFFRPQYPGIIQNF